MPQPNEEVKEPVADGAAGQETETPDSSSEEKKPAGETEEAGDETQDETESEGTEESESGEEDASEEEEKSETDEGKSEEPEGEGKSEVKKSDGSEVVVSDKSKKPKVVPGETPREYALRLEVERVKRINRDLRGQKLFNDVKPPAAQAAPELSEEDKKVLEKFEPEAVANQEKLFQVLAKKHGYVRKDEFTQTSFQQGAQAVYDEWMEKHPQYSEDQDPKGILWGRFKEEFGMYKTPANPREYVRIFNRIHNDIFGITTKDKGEKDLQEAKAKQEKLKTASHAGSASGPKTPVRQTAELQELSKVARGGGLKGMSEEDYKEMGL